MEHGHDYRIGFFGDQRRAAAGRDLFEGVVKTRSVVLRRAGGDRAGEISANRFLACERVTPDEIIKTTARRTVSACRGRRIVAAQDTTEVNFSGRHLARRGLGPGGDGVTPGFFVHAMVAVDADEEAVLGVVHADIWTRSWKRAAARRERAIEDKESIRWIAATSVAAELLCTAAQLIVVADRECDIYAHFARAPAGVELVIRVAQNRRLADGECLFDAPSDWREYGTMDIRVPPARPGEGERVACVTVKAGRVRIARPRNGADAHDPPSVMLTFVEVREIAPPKGHKQIVWRLLTTLPVCGEPDEFAAARDIARLYRLRWRIEQVFRGMKKDGLCLEETQVRDASRLFKIAAIALAAAVRIIQLVDARDGSPRPACDVADPAIIAAAQAISPTLEGNTVRQKNPHPPHSLAWLCWIVARLGGWNCYYKKPGPKTIALGWTQLTARADGYALAMATQNA